LIGDGVSMNQPETPRYFKLAVDQRFANAQHKDGAYLWHSDGVSVNQHESSKCSKGAIDQGFAFAQCIVMKFAF
jgi:hypothetical protein